MRYWEPNSKLNSDLIVIQSKIQDKLNKGELSYTLAADPLYRTAWSTNLEFESLMRNKDEFMDKINTELPGINQRFAWLKPSTWKEFYNQYKHIQVLEAMIHQKEASLELTPKKEFPFYIKYSKMLGISKTIKEEAGLRR